jgi:RNA polymerase sigma factor (sigma-70 family)
MVDELRDVWHVRSEETSKVLGRVAFGEAARRRKTGIEILATLAAPGVSATTWSRPDVTDHELVQAVRAGDEHAFERLYHRYQRRISAYVVGMVRDHGRAEDLTQEIFVSALRRMGQTDQPIAFKPWIYEIARNACIDQFRRTSRTEEVSIDADDGHGLGPADYGKLHATGPSPDAAVEGKQQLDHLCGAFEGLSQSHHEILVMRELEGLSYREIGTRLDISQASVESTLFRARRRLAEEFEDLRTGERCVRIQEIIESTVSGALGIRDQRRVGSHISHCQPCRKQAVMAGLDAAVIARRPKRAVRAKIAAFLPLPAFLRNRWLGGGSDAAGAVAPHGSALSQASMAAAHYGEPTMAGWMKATAVAAAVAVAGVGAGAADHATSGARHDAPAVQRTGAGAGGGAAAGAASSAASGAARSVARKTGAASTRGTGAAGATRSHAQRGAGTFSGTGSGPAAAGTGASGGAGGASGPSGGSGAKASTPGDGSPSSTSSSKSTSASTTAGHASSTLQDAVSGATGAAGSATGAATPLVQPDLGQLTQGPAGPPPQTAGQVVTGATDAVGQTVGGQVGDAVKQTGSAVGETVDQVTQDVAGATGGLLGGR